MGWRNRERKKEHIEKNILFVSSRKAVIFVRTTRPDKSFWKTDAKKLLTL